MKKKIKVKKVLEKQ